MTTTHTIIIPHYNDAQRLGRCLGALFAGDVSGAEILVVDNGSSQPLEALKEQFPQVTFVTENRKGAANARNRGVRESHAEKLIFLDADCIPTVGWFAAAKRADDEYDIVGGAIDVFDETPPPRSGAEAFETVFAFNYKDYFEKKGFFVTANLMTTRAVFNAVGDFVDGVSEDAEWCLRAGSKGFSLHLDESIRVAHPTRSDWSALERKWRRITREMFQLHLAGQRGRGGQAVWLLRALAMIGSIPVHIPKVMLSPKLGGLCERVKGAATLIRLRLWRSYWMIRQSVGMAI